MSEESLTKSARTRQRIIASAWALFLDQGYAATSMRQISLKAKVALGSLYNYFPSKQDLFRAIIEERHPFVQILPILNRVEGDTLEQFVRNAARTLVEELAHYPDFLNLMLIEIVEFKASHVPQLLPQFMPRLLPLAERMSALNGQLREIPPFILVRAFLGMFFAYYITGILMKPILTPEMDANSLDHFVDIFLHGVLVKETV